MRWNNDHHETYRKLAITSIGQLKIGGIYYGHYPSRFELLELITNKDHYQQLGLKWKANETANDLGWIKYLSKDGIYDAIALRDNNIGAKYNPWLIFDNEKTCQEYYAGLKTYYDHVDYQDDYYDLYSDIDLI